MGSTLKSVLAIIILLGTIGIFSYFAVTRSKPEPEEGRGYTAILMCTNPACQKIFPQRVIAGQAGPYRCKYCGRKTAYRAVRCDNCGHIFPYNVQEVSTEFGPQQIGTTECPECGYDRFTRVQSMEEVKEGAAERD
jgi:DNA-directed RNA polymerase subunit RPC12/RpoP